MILSLIANSIVIALSVLSLVSGVYVAEETKGRNVSDVGVSMYSNPVFSAGTGMLTLTVVSLLVVYAVSLLFDKSIQSLAPVGIVSYLLAMGLFLFYLRF